MNKIIRVPFFLISFILAGELLFAQATLRPFPQHVKYNDGVITPDHISRKQLDDSVRSFYNSWKERYINDDAGEGQYYIWFEKPAGNKKCVSEGQGYGMMIVVLMAGYDTASQRIFNGLFHYTKSHPSKNSPFLMAWAQARNFKDVDGSSASDGDIDIAYSLLLADAQWGSKGSINYREEARSIISAILQQEINQKTFSVLLSNAVKPDSKDYFDMRSSDFMPAHFKVFRNATGDKSWDKVIDANYKLFSLLQNRYSAGAGLFPDFIRHINSVPVPSGPHYLESKYDGYYNYNACRVPWRIATDYIVYGDKRAKEVVGKINNWIRETTQNNPDNISAGYTLAGDDIKSRNFEAMSFIASFAVAAMVDSANQAWVNKLWDYIASFDLDQFDYYDNSIKMIALLIVSGNYWIPAPTE
ncbi:MAG: glycosyl hydrolase family 8 [Bacteroidota bacterium]|nr:glycosyl hydrolase family 8 [Bacteroidota bacterium]